MLQHKVAAYKDGCCLALIDIVGILGVGKESNATLVHLLNAARFPYQGVLVALYRALQFLGYLFGCELHFK